MPTALAPGQALRGSSELHGWGDSNLYMRRRGAQLTFIAANHFPHCRVSAISLVTLYNSLDFPESIAINYRASSQASRIDVNLVG